MVSVHQEVCWHLNRTLQHILDHKMGAGVVICPATPVEAILEVLPMVNHVLVMSVNPGFGGQSFMPRSVERIAHLRRAGREEMKLNFRIEVDGGALLTIRSVRWSKQERDMLVAGSAIFQAGKTEANARDFLEVARAAEERASRKTSRQGFEFGSRLPAAPVRVGAARIEGR